MPTTKKAKATAVASASKKSAKKSSSKKVAKAPVKKVAKSAKPTKATAKKAVAKKTVVKKPAAKKTKVVANKTTAVKSPKTAKKVAKPATVKVAKPATKTVAKPIKTANVPKPTMKKPATSTQAVSPKVTSTTTSATPTRRPAASGGPSGFAPYREQHGEEYMGDKQLTHFQHILNLWKDQIHADRNIVAKQIRDDSVNFPDPLDRAVVEEEHTLEWRAREREHRLIEKIDQALASIKQGDYGFCEACGAEIGVRRLEARPTATLCIDCKTIDEIREKLSGVTE